jgi:hypothetical protein
LRLARGPGSARSPVTFSRKINPSARNWSLFGYPLRVPGH